MVAPLIAVVNTGRLNSSPKMACPRLAMLLATLLVASHAHAAPAKGAKHGRETLALAPAQADGNLSKSSLEGIDRVLASHAGANADVVTTTLLDKRAKPDFAGAVRQCKNSGPCLSRLAKALHVDAVLVPMAKPEKSGTTLNVLVAGATVHKVGFTFVTSADLNAAIASNAVALFGEGSSSPTPPAEPVESMAALPLEPLQPAIEPIEAPKVTAAAAEPAPVKLTPADPTALEPPPLDDSIVVRRAPSDLTWKTYVGATAAVVGAIGVTYGIVQYAHHKSMVSDANANPNLTQREAKDIDDDAQGAYNRSRAGVFVGTPLLLAGAALLTWDLFVDDHGKGSASTDKPMRWSLAPLIGGAAGSMTLTF